VDQSLPANSTTPDDQQILAQLRRGNFAAMEQLVLRYQNRLYTTVFRIVNQPDDAADLVQETFVKALENLTGFEGKSSFYTWLYRIAINLALTQKRRQRYRHAASLDAAANPADDLNRQADTLRAQLAQHTEPDPATAAAAHLDAQRVLDALARLDLEPRTLIVMRDIDALDYQQIAETLEVPVGTVKSRLFRARVALRNAVERAESSRPRPDHAAQEGPR